MTVSRFRAAVLFLALTLPAPALGQAGPNVLTTAQVAAFEQLVSAAKSVDPTYLQAQAAELQKRAELSPLGAVNVSAPAAYPRLTERLRSGGPGVPAVGWRRSAQTWPGRHQSQCAAARTDDQQHGRGGK